MKNLSAIKDASARLQEHPGTDALSADHGGSINTSGGTAGPKVEAQPSHMHYRPDIDGLRAVAVLSVIIFHAFPRWLGGGFAGVDIFFVISGFLISSILFASFQKGTFSFLDFYSRRARRIFPALIVVFLPVAFLGWYVLTPDEFSALGKQIAAGAGFVANISLWMEAGYFDTSAEVKPLLHLWSLGVEEQFYIIWPLLLWAASKKKWNFFIVGSVLAAASFAANIFAIESHASAVFYLPVTRFWELLAGAGVAYAVVVLKYKDVGSLFPAKLGAAVAANLVSLLGFLLLIVSILVLDKSRAFPGWWAVIPVLGAVLVIAAGPAAFINRFILGNRLMVGLGLISYPLYLWHWPLLVFGRILNGNMSKEMRFGLIVAAVMLAWATYHIVEKKLRRPDPDLTTVQNNTRLTLLYVFMGIFCAAGLAAYAGSITARSNTTDVDELLKAQYDWEFPSREFAKLSTTGPNFYTRAGTEPGYVLFIGDSIVEQYAPRVNHVLSNDERPRYSVIFATGPGCPPMLNVVHVAMHKNPACPGTASAAYELAHRKDVKRVVIGGNWNNYLNEKNSSFMYKSQTQSLVYGQPGAIDAAFAALEEQIKVLSREKQVYIILNAPKSFKFSPKSMLDGSRWTVLHRRQQTPDIDISDYVGRQAVIQERLMAISQRHGVKVIDPIKALCNGNVCPAVSQTGEPYYMDNEHMRPFYVRDKATFIDETIISQPGQ
ncbi:acyltransferase family protein [Pseudoduganella umbonata]|uniref:Acyltransferase n=1 Tax=Pseudoduganella umbonata TaxID=864828 RepID=A0A4P8HVS2_9BURK|nr:acyltransferase family protein [Pseudoduganella umbonata]MBB3222338.1 peptidoglycan/LPS O-acetylase OafA/YrhL [Pseudoduganella umbonata]QCP12554.1 acyltransferase [Pseudoduganella umbonata]